MLHWLEDNWAWLIGIIIAFVGGIMIPILLRNRSYIEYLSDWSVRRISDDKIRVNEGIVINSISPTRNCKGTLQVHKAIIKLPEAKFANNGINQYVLVMDGEYKGAFTGKALLKLRVTLGDRKHKAFKKYIDISIPDKYDNKPKPPQDIVHLGLYGSSSDNEL